MIKFTENRTELKFHNYQFPILNIKKIVLSTNHKNSLERLFGALLVINFSENGGRIFEKKISLGEFINPNQVQPILEANIHFNVINEYNLKLKNGSSNWTLSIKLDNFQFMEKEILNVFTIDPVNSDEISKKLKSYLFEKIDLFNSYEKKIICINNKAILTRVTFSDDYVSEKIFYKSEFSFNDYIVTINTVKDQLHKLLPYTIKDQYYSISLDRFDTLIEPFDVIGELYKEEEFGSKNDGLLYYLNRNLKRNAGVLAYRIGENFSETFPEELLEKIDETFNINLKYIDFKSALLCFIFKKSILSLSTSHIFVDNDKECLRVLIDTDRYLNHIDYLGKLIVFEIELFDKLKHCFFKKKIYLSDLIKNDKFIPSFFEVVPNTKDQIFSSTIKIFMNEKLHDKMEASYIRNIKLNIEIKKP